MFRMFLGSFTNAASADVFAFVYQLSPHSWYSTYYGATFLLRPKPHSYSQCYKTLRIHHASNCSHLALSPFFLKVERSQGSTPIHHVAHSSSAVAIPTFRLSAPPHFPTSLQLITPRLYASAMSSRSIQNESMGSAKRFSCQQCNKRYTKLEHLTVRSDPGSAWKESN